jgi:APA family basic amino acid/polyamine antiporter
MENNIMEKRFGLPTAVAMVVGIVIGSGVYVKGGKVLNCTGYNMGQGVLVVAIVGVICIICSLVFAQLSSKYAHVNGLVDYAEVALGRKYAYYVGWFLTTIYTPSLVVMLAFFSALMFCTLVGLPALSLADGCISAEMTGVAAGFMIIGYGINIISPKLAGKMQVGMTVIKLIPLVIMGVVGTIVGLLRGDSQVVLDFINSPDYIPKAGGIFAGVVGFAFAYEGWILATTINQELKDAKKNLPIALIGGALIATVIYTLYIFSMTSVGSVEEIVATWPLGETLAYIAFNKLFGNKLFGTIALAFVTVSCLGTMNGLIMSNCRSQYSLAVRGMGPMPKFFGDVDDQNNFCIKSSLFGMIFSGFWFIWFTVLWWQGPDWFAKNHNFVWLGWEPDEICIINLYLMYIPMFAAIYKKFEGESAWRRYILPTMGIICCCFMLYSCWIGKGAEQCIGYAIFFIIDLLIGRIFMNPKADYDLKKL